MSNNFNSVKCIKCGLVNFGKETECKRCNTPIDTVTLLANKKHHFEYKILTQKDSFFGGRFNSEMLEAALNEYSAQGWRVVSSVSASIQALTANREEMVIIMEREKR